MFHVVEDKRAGRAVPHHLLVDLVTVGGEQRLPVTLVQAVRGHGVGLEGGLVARKMTFR